MLPLFTCEHMRATAMNDTLNCDPKTKDEWRQLLDYLYENYIACHLPVTICPPAIARGSLYLDGYIGINRIGKIV